MKRTTMLITCLLLAAIVGCNADWLTGRPAPPCFIVAFDSLWAVNADRTDSVKAVLYRKVCP